MTARSGSMLLEVVLALSLIAAAMVAIAQIAIVASYQRREAEWAGIASREAANLMERVMQLGWEDVNQDRFAEWELSQHAQQRLRSPELSITISEQEAAGDIRQKEILISVAWQNSAGRPAQPVSLSAWTFSGVDPE